MGGFEEVRLPPSQYSDACEKDISAYFYRGESSAPTFVLLPGAFASWTHRSFNYQTAEKLKETYPGANILAFAGYLSSGTLKNSCSKVPWNGESYAADLRARIISFLNESRMDRDRVGIVGYSGGAYLASMIMGLDGFPRMSEDPLVTLGGIAFSPILDGYTAFKTLDAGIKKSKIPKSRHLLNPGTGELAKQFGKFFIPYWGKKMFIKGMENNKEFEDLFYNMFDADLKSIVSHTLGENQIQNNEMTYLNVFVNMGFGSDNPLVPKNERLGMFKVKTNVGQVVEKAQNDLVIVFPQDDPVLSALPGQAQPEAITKTIARLRKNSNIYIYNPKYGGHTGSLLDRPFWDKLITTFFSHKLSQVE